MLFKSLQTPQQFDSGQPFKVPTFEAAAPPSITTRTNPRWVAVPTTQNQLQEPGLQKKLVATLHTFDLTDSKQVKALNALMASGEFKEGKPVYDVKLGDPVVVGDKWMVFASRQQVLYLETIEEIPDNHAPHPHEQATKSRRRSSTRRNSTLESQVCSGPADGGAGPGGNSGGTDGASASAQSAT